MLAYKYLGNTAAALVANANLGGDSCHRGSLLGVVMGAAGVPQKSAKALEHLQVRGWLRG